LPSILFFGPTSRLDAAPATVHLSPPPFATFWTIPPLMSSSDRLYPDEKFPNALCSATFFQRFRFLWMILPRIDCGPIIDIACGWIPTPFSSAWFFPPTPSERPLGCRLAPRRIESRHFSSPLGSFGGWRENFFSLEVSRFPCPCGVVRENGSLLSAFSPSLCFQVRTRHLDSAPSDDEFFLVAFSNIGFLGCC